MTNVFVLLFLWLKSLFFSSDGMNPVTLLKVLYSTFPSTIPKFISWIMSYCTKIGTIQNPIAIVLYQMYQDCIIQYQNGIVLYQMVLYCTKWYNVLQPHSWYYTVPNGDCIVPNGIPPNGTLPNGYCILFLPFDG